MISYHERIFRGNKRAEARFYTPGFKTADTDDIARIARGISKFVWAPGIFRDGYRKKENFLSTDWIGLDFDSGELTLDQAASNTFCDMRCIIGTSQSHQTGARPVDKFRVVIPLERRVTDLRLFEHQLALAGKKWPLANKCTEGARMFFPCKQIVCVNVEGDSWELDEDLPPEFDHGSQAMERVKHGCIPLWAFSMLRIEWEAHTKNDNCFKLGCALGIHGFSPQEIMDLIIAGPTYKGKFIPKKEILEAISSGVKRGLKDLK